LYQLKILLHWSAVPLDPGDNMKAAKDFFKSSGFPDFHKHGLVDMYTKASSDEMKKSIRVIYENGWEIEVIGSYHMGVNCTDIRNVVHLGPPSSLVQYVQESGRVGRDGCSSVALLLHGSASEHVQQSVESYCTNKNAINYLRLSFLY